MYLELKIKGILEGLRPAFIENNIDFEFAGVKDGIIEVRLLSWSGGCTECETPEHILEAILLSKIKEDLPIIRGVKFVKLRKEVSEYGEGRNGGS